MNYDLRRISVKRAPSGEFIKGLGGWRVGALRTDSTKRRTHANDTLKITLSFQTFVDFNENYQKFPREGQ